MIIGFTGTQQGMTDSQKRYLESWLYTLASHNDESVFVGQFVHGDCIGADEEAVWYAKRIGYKTIAYPCNIDEKRAWTVNEISFSPEDPLKRNKVIVDTADIIIACPKEAEEQLRSGTWATIRYTRKNNKPLVLLGP